MSETDPDVDAVAAAIGAVPSVRLHEGSAVGTHLPGRRVPGIRVTGDGGAEIHAAVVYPATVDEAARAIRAAVAGLVPGPVDVTIDDVVAEETPSPEPGRTSEEET